MRGTTRPQEIINLQPCKMPVKCCQKRLEFPDNLVLAVPGRLTSVEYVQPTDKMNPVLDLKASDILRKITISPDITLLSTNEEDSYRKRSYSYTQSSNLIDQPTVRRKASVTDFEEILKDLKEDGCSNDQGYCSRSSSLSPPSTGDDNFYDISLEEEMAEEVAASDSAQERNHLIRLFDELLADIYSVKEDTSVDRRWSEMNIYSSGDQRKKYIRYQSVSVEALRKKLNFPAFSEFQETFFADAKNANKDNLTLEELTFKSNHDLEELKECLQASVELTGQQLVVELEEKDTLITEQQDACAFITANIQAFSNKRSEDTHVKFSVAPLPGDSGFEEWATAMKMVARLPDGIPAHFRKTLWLTLAEKHLASRGVHWPQTERALFNDSSNPDDHELSVQIVKDLHRTGCSLFCGVSGQHNQAVLKRVLLAYARWNKSVGYCQGLNMLAALILQVMQGSQSATVKVMIYLIEGVLPESYFANNLRGLSVDMTVFRDLLRLKLPELSKHLDHLQHDSKDPGTNYEPPLMDVFTMQWFLTIFSNCLPQSTVLRVWDLIFLEGNQVLLKTALAIWQTLSERMMVVRSADEFYSIMAVLTREMLEFGLMEPNNLIKAIDTLMIPEVNELREKYVYNITPWTVSTVAKKGLKLFYSDPYDSDEDHLQSYQSSSIDGHKYTPYSNHPDREKIALDISVLKRQYSKLRERQRQAHIILSAACSSETLTPTNSPTLNHLLLGKSALLNQVKGRRIQGAIPTPTGSSQGKQRSKQVISGETLHWRDAQERKLKRSSRSEDSDDVSRERNLSSSSSSSSSTELCDDSSDTDDGLSLNEDKKGLFIEPSTTQEEPPSNPPSQVEKEEEPEDKEGSSRSNEARRDSEMALLQILQENSEILQRIQSHSSISVISESPERESLSPDSETQEPRDITEIRKKYDKLRQASLEVAPTPKPSLDKAFSSFDSPSKGTSYPFPKSPKRNKGVGIKLGLYSPE